MKSFLTLFLLSVLLLANLTAGPREAEWAKVDEAARAGLPKTAIERLEPIIAGAVADQNYPEAMRAIARRIAFETQIQGGKREEAIHRLQAELAKAPAAMQPVMEAVLAHWYWSYFQQHRWRIMQRSRSTGAAGPDLETWDLTRLLAEIDRHFTAALAGEAALQSIPISTFNELLETGTVPDTYRPTLFDFLVYDALPFYQAGEQGAVHAEDAFVPDAASAILAPAAQFLEWRPETTDSDSPVLKAIGLYQKLLRFHQNDAERSAYFDADLARLEFASNVAVGETKPERYKEALRHFIADTSNHEVSARALVLLAQQLIDDPPAAHALAQRGVDTFPDSAGGALCFNLLQQIESPSTQLATEFVWNAPWPTLDLTYRNLTKVYFRAVPLSFADHFRRTPWNLGLLHRDEYDVALSVAPVLEWSADLPPTTDYRNRTERLPAPGTLPPGFYAIIASASPAFATNEDRVSAAAIWVSDLAVVTRTEEAKGVDGFVLRAGTGEPVKGARVRLWKPTVGVWSEDTSTTTDANGSFRLPQARGQFVLLAEDGAQLVSTIGTLFSQPGDEYARIEQTFFFTDRAIYRPGQTIHYKGMCAGADENRQKCRVLAERKVEVVFLDSNAQEIARASHLTNAYGSFSGTFTAPRDRLGGEMSISVESGPDGDTGFSVEEYKRPKFEVEIAAPREAAKLDARVELAGKAAAYTGAAIGGAQVKWRVARAVRLPLWCWWWQPSPTQAIAHGTAVTAADGSFKVEFTAAPDRTVPAKLEPVFRYSIHADVTDLTGETRSVDREVAAGYTALQASIIASEWLTPDRPVDLTLATQSLDDVPQAAAGSLTIHRLRQPEKVERADLRPRSTWVRTSGTPPSDPTNPDSWAEAEIVAQQPFATDESGTAKISARLPAGIYRAALATKDRFGQAVTSRLTLRVVDPGSRALGIKVPSQLVAPEWSVEPGQKFLALWGTGYDSGRAFVELECAGQVLQRRWTPAGRTQDRIELPVTEAMRGDLTLRVTFVRENRAYIVSRRVTVPWSNKELALTWGRFRSKLLPGQKETWTATIRDSRAKGAPAEMVATLYDASLDEFNPLSWPDVSGLFRSEPDASAPQFHNAGLNFQAYGYPRQEPTKTVNWRYRAFRRSVLSFWSTDPEYLNSVDVQPSGGTWTTDDQGEILVLSPFRVQGESDTGYTASSTLAGTRISTQFKDVGSAVTVVTKQFLADTGSTHARDLLAYAPSTAIGGLGVAPDLNKVVARKNLHETAFFFPQVIAKRKGVVTLKFTLPESLTRWRFLGFAHDKNLRSGFLAGETVTAKDLMVEPNPPRFVREGDMVEFTVKVSNQADQPQTGRVRLTFADAATLTSADAALGNLVPEQTFDVPARQARTYSWRVTVPDGMGFLTYKAVGATATISDGEEGYLPVLSRRILVTESVPLPIRGPATKDFEFKKLLASGQSTTLRHQSLTVQMVSQPAWYAVLALPYLMEFPHECSEQIFSRFYANALARHIANSDPKIRRTFDLWKNTPALDSPLAKNQDLKSVMLEETPWLRDANRESESRRNVGQLFDANRLDEEAARTLAQLAERQSGDGLWSWFPGGPTSEYISLYIMTGFGRLRHLGVAVDSTAAIKALAGLDKGMQERYREISRRPHPEAYRPGYTDALYLYGRSFFLQDQPVAPENQEALEFFLHQSRRYWTGMGSRQSQAHLALALQRFGDQDTPQAIVKSLKERSVTTEELGMFWRDLESGWWWHQAPVESQAMMIEVFAEVARDEQAVAGCQVWLLKQKQTQDWKTTKATADAVYSLLIRGSNLLASDALVEVSLAGVRLKPEQVEAGTGFYEQKFVRDEIKPAMGHITLKKTDAGVSWGSAHWQYLEDMAKVTPHEGTPLKLKKALFVRENTKQGPVLKPVTGPVAVGDELVVRLELRVDRAMEYVHLKDQRGSGTEPVNVLSQYKHQDGLGYYESTRDTASHFFIESLPQGTYVFEYSTRVQLKGRYQSGLAEIQCMYAPEFNSHSESLTIEAR